MNFKSIEYAKCWKLLLKAKLIAKREAAGGIYFLYHSEGAYLEAYSPAKAGGQKTLAMVHNLDHLASFSPLAIR